MHNPTALSWGTTRTLAQNLAQQCSVHLPDTNENERKPGSAHIEVMDAECGHHNAAGIKRIRWVVEISNFQQSGRKKDKSDRKNCHANQPEDDNGYSGKWQRG